MSNGYLPRLSKWEEDPLGNITVLWVEAIMFNIFCRNRQNKCIGLCLLVWLSQTKLQTLYPTQFWSLALWNSPLMSIKNLICVSRFIWGCQLAFNPHCPWAYDIEWWFMCKHYFTVLIPCTDLKLWQLSVTNYSFKKCSQCTWILHFKVRPGELSSVP